MFHGDAQALDDVSLEIAEGAIVAIVGANGAGKTSLIRTIAGMHRPARGRILFRGTDIAGWPSHRVCDLGIGQVAEGRQIFPDAARSPRTSTWARCCRARAPARAKNLERVLALFPMLAERRDRPPARCRAASSRCSRSAAASWARRSSSCSTSRRSGWRPAVVQDVLQHHSRSQSRRAHLRAGRAERRGVAAAREPRLCAGERPRHAVRDGRGAAGR